MEKGVGSLPYGITEVKAHWIGKMACEFVHVLMLVQGYENW